MNLFERVYKFFGGHVHERELFCVGNLAFVKCVTCGAESIPWEVSEAKANAYKEFHPNEMDRLLAIKEKITAECAEKDGD